MSLSKRTPEGLATHYRAIANYTEFKIITGFEFEVTCNDCSNVWVYKPRNNHKKRCPCMHKNIAESTPKLTAEYYSTIANYTKFEVINNEFRFNVVCNSCNNEWLFEPRINKKKRCSCTHTVWQAGTPTPVDPDVMAVRHQIKANYTKYTHLGNYSFNVTCNACSNEWLFEPRVNKSKRCLCMHKPHSVETSSPELTAKYYSKVGNYTKYTHLGNYSFNVVCNTCSNEWLFEPKVNSRKRCSCEHTQTGPKVLSGKEFALRHCNNPYLNFTLLKVLAIRKFKVKCNSCAVIRTVEHKQGNFGGCCCICYLKQPFKRIARTPKTHTEEIQALGFTEYQCLGINTNVKDGMFKYKHSCGNVFKMTKGTFVGCNEPCEQCRILGKTEEEYIAQLAAVTNKLVLVGKYTDCRVSTMHRFVECGHEYELVPDSKRLSVDRTYADNCLICRPTKFHNRFTLKDKNFITRSIVEKAFVTYLVEKFNVGVNDIIYEPKECKVKYFNPVKNRYALYNPDFKVKNTVVEIKDLTTLGLLDTFFNKKPKEVLIENRAKCVAAQLAFKKYKIFVYIKGKFYLTDKFWLKSEKERLLAIYNSK